jgi:GT2 family glycosyltransferase
MAKIIMAVYDTDDNKRSVLTARTILGLLLTVDFNKHQLFISDNGSCASNHGIVYPALRKDWREMNFPIDNLKIHHNGKNIGTANAVNKGIAEREPGQFIIKMDNDVIIHSSDWVEQLEEAMTREPKIGILGLKRRDLLESTTNTDTACRSKLIQLPHNPGERWYVVETCKHVMGTCTMLSPDLLDKIGGFYQMDGIYGFDDSLMCVRAAIAGYMCGFLTGIDIDHIDPGGTDYTKEKADYAGMMADRYRTAVAAYKSGLRPIKEAIS